VSSGHNNRKGRGGNRRDRQGSARPHHPPAQNATTLATQPAVTAVTGADAARTAEVMHEKPEPFLTADSVYTPQPETAEAEPSEGHRTVGAQEHSRPVHSVPFARATEARRAMASHRPVLSTDVQAGSASESEAEPTREPVDVRGDLGPLIDSLHELFERDRAVASQGGSTRCGICYLYYKLADLTYREADGMYVCARCARALGSSSLRMVRRQQKL